MATIRAYHDLVTVLRTTLATRGQSARGAALAADLPIRSIQGVLEGHEPRLTRVIQVASALGYDLRLVPRSRREAVGGFGPPRAVEGAGEPNVRPGGHLPAAASPGAGPGPVRDPRLADLIAAIAARWEELAPEERGHLLADLWDRGGSGLRAHASRTSSLGSDGA